MSKRSHHPQADEIDRVARLLFDAWAAAEPDHGVTKHAVSYIATFADMARAIVEDRERNDHETSAMLLASRRLVSHLVDRILNVPEFAWYVGFGSRSRELLDAAATALFDEDPAEIKRRLDAAPVAKSTRLYSHDHDCDDPDCQRCHHVNALIAMRELEIGGTP